jgi:hypothetical protein
MCTTISQTHIAHIRRPTVEERSDQDGVFASISTNGRAWQCEAIFSSKRNCGGRMADPNGRQPEYFLENSFPFNMTKCNGIGSDVRNS